MGTCSGLRCFHKTSCKHPSCVSVSGFHPSSQTAGESKVGHTALRICTTQYRARPEAGKHLVSPLQARLECRILEAFVRTEHLSKKTKKPDETNERLSGCELVLTLAFISCTLSIGGFSQSQTSLARGGEKPGRACIICQQIVCFHSKSYRMMAPLSGRKCTNEHDAICDKLARWHFAEPRLKT